MKERKSRRGNKEGEGEIIITHREWHGISELVGNLPHHITSGKIQ
jgi:hypothetical protein